MCDDDTMKPKFSFVEITPISKVSSISVIKCKGCSFTTIKDSTRFFLKFGPCFNRLPRTCRHKLSTLYFSDCSSLCTFLVVILVTSFQNFRGSIQFFFFSSSAFPIWVMRDRCCAPPEVLISVFSLIFSLGVLP